MVIFTILFYCARRELPSCAVGSICSVHLVTMATPFMCPACQSEGGWWLRKFRACDVEITGDIHQDVFIPSLRIKDFSNLGPDLDTKLPWFFMKFSILAEQVQTFFMSCYCRAKGASLYILWASWLSHLVSYLAFAPSCFLLVCSTSVALSHSYSILSSLHLPFPSELQIPDTPYLLVYLLLLVHTPRSLPRRFNSSVATVLLASGLYLLPAVGSSWLARCCVIHFQALTLLPAFWDQSCNHCCRLESLEVCGARCY